jgi:transcriptional antiterminator RfaH
MLRWYLIHTKPSREATAQVHLERQGLEVYFPRVIQAVRRAGQWRDQISALFPRYLFLRLDAGNQSLAPVHSTVGVSNVVRFGAHFTIVADRVIRELQSRMDEATGFHRLNTRPQWLPGMPVHISSGPFDGLEGVFDREAGDDRVLVLLKVLGQLTSVRLSVDCVLPSALPRFA